MEGPGGQHRYRRVSVGVAWCLVALVLYASLYPLTGWRWPAGVEWQDLLRLPSAPRRDAADVWLNWIGYVPVGGALAIAALRSGHQLTISLLWSLATAVGLSYAMELMQTLVPPRVPSWQDWWDNTRGAAVGVLGALVLHASGAVSLMARWRDHHFTRDSALPLTLLLLWPAALLAPSPVPFGLGQLWNELLHFLVRGLASVPLSSIGWTVDWSAWLAPGPPLSARDTVVAMALSMIAPWGLACSIVAPGASRLWFLLLLAVLGAAALSLSTAMQFGPAQALAWQTPPVTLAGVFALLLALPMAWLPRRLSAVAALLLLAFGVALVSQATPDAYHLAHLQTWEQGRFIRLHGLSLWVAWVWPYACIAWLALHLVRRGHGADFLQSRP